MQTCRSGTRLNALRPWPGPPSSAIVPVSAQQTAVVDYPIRAVPLAQVQVTGEFWRAKIETNRTVTIPHILQQNESRMGFAAKAGDTATN